MQSFFCQEDNETNEDYSITLISSGPQHLFYSVRNTGKRNKERTNKKTERGMKKEG